MTPSMITLDDSANEEPSIILSQPSNVVMIVPASLV